MLKKILVKENRTVPVAFWKRPIFVVWSVWNIQWKIHGSHQKMRMKCEFFKFFTCFPFRKRNSSGLSINDKFEMQIALELPPRVLLVFHSSGDCSWTDFCAWANPNMQRQGKKKKKHTKKSYSISMATSIPILQVKQLPFSPLTEQKLLKALHTLTFGQK